MVFQKEIENYFLDKKINIIAFNLSYLQKDKNGLPFNFKTYKTELLKNADFQSVTKEYNEILLGLQNAKRPLEDIDNFFKVIMFNRIYKLEKAFLRKLNGEFIDYEKIPSFVVWAYSYANKIGSGNFRRNIKEMNDVSMSYIAPYVDILVVEKTIC